MKMSKQYKYLRCNQWFHGTTLAGWKEICEKGILSNHNIGHELDFGYGFYLAPKREQAERFINNIIRVTQGNREIESEISTIFSIKENYEDQIAVVIEFSFCPIDWVEDYKYMIFGSYDDDFANFVFYNRTLNADGSNQHDFDFICGVMSDSNPIVDILRYKSGEIGETEVIESFKKPTSAKQISIHNQRLCDKLKPNRAYIIETGEELNINDYIN